MSGATKISGELQAGTSGTTDSSAMETEEYYNPEGGEWSQKVDTGQLCRVCANPNEYLIPIFDGEGLEHELSVKIEKHLPIKVTETDALPQQMCYQCASTLIAWHDLVLNCVEADKKLRELQADEDDDDDDKGAEMFESHSMDSDPADEVDQPSTSESQITAKLQVPKKTVLSKDKKPKLKMVLVKGSLAGTSGQKTVAKTQVAKALELAKSKEGGNEDSASERCQQTPLTSFKAFQEAKNSLKNKYGQKDSADSSTHSLVWVRSEKNVWNCNYCNKSFSSKSDMEKHAASHSENTIVLKHSVQFKDTDKLPVDSVIRDLGSREVEWSNKIRISVITSEGSGCEKRSEMREKKADLVRKDFSCKICERTFTRKYDLKRHLKCHSQMLVEVEEPNLMIGNDTSGKCGDMDWENETLNYETFEEEEDDEKDEKSNRLNTFHCAECGKHFKLKDSYYRHLRIHTGERPFTCHICGKQFRDSGGLARHLKDVHARIKNFSCDLCGRSFASKATTEDHRRIHTGERPYICDSCGKTFKSKASLYIHAKIHSDSFPYDCSSCEKRFRRRQELLAHVTTHTGEKPHACEVCGRCFRVRGELLRHKLVHSEEKPHVCTECGLTFRQKRYLKNHQKTRHPKSDVNV